MNRFKKIMSLLTILLITGPLLAVMVHTSNIENRVRQQAALYLEHKGYPKHMLPKNFLIEFDQKAMDVTQTLKNDARLTGRTYVDADEIESTVRSSFRKLYENLKTIVLAHNLEKEIRHIIRKHFRAHNIDPDKIKTQFKTEYYRIRKNIITELRNVMAVDRRTYVRIYEIENKSKKSYEDLISRIKKDLSGGTSFWDFLFGSSSTSSKPESHPSSEEKQKIKRHELDNRVLDIINKRFRAYEIDPDNVPARVFSDYSDAVHSILKTLRDRMATYNRTYVMVSEAELIVAEKLKPVIDKIHFKGERCTVCLMDYESRDKLGYLNCEHFFHYDCIAAWIATKPNCPLCRHNNAYIKEYEFVP